MGQAFKLHVLLSLFMLHLASSEEQDLCQWEKITDPCHPLAHPDGSDIACQVEVKNCTGVPFQCRYKSPCSSDECAPYVEGSISKRAATAYKSKLWPGGVVPYKISESYSDYQKDRILKGMRHWEDNTCIRFRERTTEVDYIVFHNGSCCCTYVGHSGGQHSISLHGGCLYFRAVTHEIGHALGFWHEQSRPDRDEHVNIYFDRMRQGVKSQFRKLPMQTADSYGTPYDATSVMQYTEYAFSANGQKTMESKYGIPLGGSELSPVDILQTRRMYQCPSDPKNDPPKMVPPPLPPKLPAEAQSCGKVLTGINGSFSSPNYPQHYSENKICGWLIPIPKGFTVQVTLQNIALDHSSSCGDHIALYSGLSGQSSPIKKICSSSGSNFQFENLWVLDLLYIRFQSDSLKGSGTGFRGHFKLKDIDECALLGRFGCYPNKCINTFGSYHCDCPKGLFNPTVYNDKCLDINECMDDNHGCSHKCINTYKSYICTCPDGMKLGSDKKSCIGGPCLTAGCQHSCTDTGNRVQCNCRPGYVINPDQKTCRDIDECKTGTHSCQQNCHNTPGSYRCSCQNGYRLLSNGKCEDIDECKTGTHNCQQNCHNNPGSYRCSCKSGYRLLANGRCETAGDTHCGGIVNTVFTTDLTSSGYPAPITTTAKCNWLLVKPPNRREVRITFTQFDVTGNAACSDNRVEIYDGLTRRLASICGRSAVQRTFTLRSGFSLLKLIVTNPQNFRGFHAKLTVV